MDSSASPVTQNMRLLLSIGLPVAALAVIYAIATALPTPECGEGGGASSLEMALFVALVAVASLTCVVAAVAGPLRQWWGPDPSARPAAWALVTGLLSLYLLAAALSYLAIFVLVLIGQSGIGC